MEKYMMPLRMQNKDTEEESKQNGVPSDKKFLENGYNYKLFINQLIDEQRKKLVREARSRGIKQEHIDLYSETETFVDFSIDNLVVRMIKEGIVSKENGYDDLNLIKHPNGIEAVKKRRTEAELDQMKDA